MHLSDGSGRQRAGLEFGKKLSDGFPQPLFRFVLRTLAGKRCHSILQALQRKNIIIRQQVTMQAKALAKFYECCAQPLQDVAQPLGRRHPGAPQMQTDQQPPE